MTNEELFVSIWLMASAYLVLIAMGLEAVKKEIRKHHSSGGKANATE